MYILAVETTGKYASVAVADEKGKIAAFESTKDAMNHLKGLVPMIEKALCLPMTIGSTTGGMVLFTVCALGKQPACMLFSKPIDPLAASGAILGDVWTDATMPVVDSLGDEFLEYVQTGMTVTIKEDGVVEVG